MKRRQMSNLEARYLLAAFGFGFLALVTTFPVGFISAIIAVSFGAAAFSERYMSDEEDRHEN
jgi:lauroyl/myristoyl acyltransferase